MSTKTFVWGGMSAGSIAGSFVPLLWGAGLFSFSSVLLTAVGGLLGIWAGYSLGKRLF